MKSKPNQYSLLELIEIITHAIGDLEVAFIKTYKDSGLSSNHLKYIEIINRLDHPSSSELAKVLNLSKPSVTAIIDKFVEKEYVQRVKSDDDRRSAHIHLTAKGEEIVKIHDQTHKAIADLFYNNLRKKDLNNLVVILNKVIKNIPY